jgi:prepilin-type N-terminal cleavage/methylation domain-containing protein
MLSKPNMNLGQNHSPLSTARKHTPAQIRQQRGFSMIEMLVAVVLLMAVLGVVVKGMTDMQRYSFTESSKTDAVEDARNFIDQVVRDIHMTGYPPPRATVVGGVTPYCTDALGTGVPNVAMRDNPGVSCGIIQFSPTTVIYEGDLDGSGTVSTVVLQLLAGPNGRCPCTVQRGVVTKAQWIARTQPQFFTTINGVLNSGNGANPGPPASLFNVNLPGPGNYAAFSNADVFDAYVANGNPFPALNCSLGEVNTPAITNPDCSQIRSLQVTANVTPQYADPTSKQFPVYSITSKARINF